MGEGRGGEGKGGGVGFSSVGGVPTGKNGSFFDAGVPTGGGWVSSHFSAQGEGGFRRTKRGSNSGNKKKS